MQPAAPASAQQPASGKAARRRRARKAAGLRAVPAPVDGFKVGDIVAQKNCQLCTARVVEVDADGDGGIRLQYLSSRSGVLDDNTPFEECVFFYPENCWLGVPLSQ